MAARVPVRPSTRRSRRPWTSTGCSSPSPAASAPVSRWRSRRWPGWCAAFEPPVYCYHEIVHNKLVVERFEAPGRGVRRRHRRRARRAARSCCRRTARRPRSSPRPGARQLRRRLGVPAGHQGAPRGQGPCRQGLPDRLRRPRGPRGGGRHDGRRARRRSAASSRSPRSTRCPSSTSRSRCSPRPRCRTATGRASPCAVQRALPRRVDARPQRPLLRHHQPPVGADGDGRAVRRDRRHRLGQLVEHRGAREAGPRSRLPERVYRVNAADELPDDLSGTVGRHRRCVGARGAGRQP